MELICKDGSWWGDKPIDAPKKKILVCEKDGLVTDERSLNLANNNLSDIYYTYSR